MATYAVRYTQPLLGAIDALGRLVAVPGASVLIRQNGVAATVYSSRTKAALTNPIPTGVAQGAAGIDTTGNLTVYLEPGDGYDFVATVGTTSTTVAMPTMSADYAEPIAPAAVTEAMLSFGVATQAELDSAISGLSGTYVPTAGETAITGGLDITAAADGDVPFIVTATEATGDQTISARFTPTPGSGGIQGFVLERSNKDRPLGILWKENGTVETAIAIDAGTTDLILYWSHNTPGDQIRVREGPHIQIGRSVGHPDDLYRLKIDAVVGDPAAMADLLQLAVNTAAPAVRALRINNETNTLLSVKTDNSGVGIGTLTPGAQLHVVNSQDATTQFLLANGNNTALARASARVQSASGSLFLESYPAAFTTVALAGHSMVYTTGTADLILGTAGTDRIHLAANGRIGMGGTTIPAAWLDINAPSDLAVLRLTMAAAAATNPFVIVDSVGAQVFTVSNVGRIFGFTGSAGTAGIGFLSDPDTGIFSNAANNLQFTAGGTERGRFSATSFQLSDAINLVVGATTGTKIGTATTQKLGFWNATPVVQQARPTDAASIITLLTTLGLCA